MKKLIVLLLAAVLLFGAVLYFCPPSRLPEQLLPASYTVRQWVGTAKHRIWPEPEPSPDALSYEVIAVIDGDTLLISIFGAETTVRLIGVDAPESVHREKEKNTPEGELASAWLKTFLEGKRVTLEYDQELKDQYGRTLAYVYADGMMLEDVLLMAGMAKTLTMESNTRYHHHFEQLEKQAREGGNGFWGTGFFEG